MLIAIAQLRSRKVSPVANERAILAAVAGARQAGARMLVTSGGALTGAVIAVPPADEIADSAVDASLATIAGHCEGMVALIGIGAPAARSARPPLAMIEKGRVRSIAASGDRIEIEACRVGFADAAALDTAEPDPSVRDSAPPDTPAAIRSMVASGLDAMLVIGASAYRIGAHRAREARMAALACAWGVPLVWVNALGAAGSSVFDGASFQLDAGGRRIQQLPAWRETLALIRIGGGLAPVRGDLERDSAYHLLSALTEAIAAIATGGQVRVAAPRDPAGALAVRVARDAVGAAAVSIADAGPGAGGVVAPPASVVEVCPVNPGDHGFEIIEARAGRLRVHVAPALATAALRLRESFGGDAAEAIPGMP